MDELNLLAQRVWKRVARGEAYEQPPKPKPVCKPQGVPIWLLVLLIFAMQPTKFPGGQG